MKSIFKQIMTQKSSFQLSYQRFIQNLASINVPINQLLISLKIINESTLEP